MSDTIFVRCICMEHDDVEQRPKHGPILASSSPKWESEFPPADAVVCQYSTE